MRSELKTRLKAARAAAAAGDEHAAEALRQAQRRLAKATSKGIVHKNQAARRTSRMMKAANRAEQG